MISFKFSIFILLVIPIRGFAQSEFSGVLLNTKDNIPIAFAHLEFDEGYGSITNNDGTFLIRSKVDLDSLEIKISAMGYQDHSIYIYENSKNQIFLESKNIKLDEVVIKYEDPAKKLIEEVINKIPENYPRSFENLYGEINENTYWDSLHTKSIYKARVNIRADKFSYEKKQTSGNIELINKKIELYDYDSLDIRFYAGVHKIHTGDFVIMRNDVLTKNRLKSFNIKIEDTLAYKNTKVAKVIYQNRDIHGKIYIDLETYAIVRVERTIEPKLVKKPFNFLSSYKRIYFYEIIDYKRANQGKWRLMFIHYKTGFKNKKKDKEVHLDNTFFLTKNEKANTAIPINNRIQFSDILIDKIIHKHKNSKDKLFSVLKRFKVFTSFFRVPFKINNHEIQSTLLDLNTNIDDQKRNIYAFQLGYDYNIKNNWGFRYFQSSSIQKKEYENYSLGLWRKNDIDISGKFNYILSSTLDYRKLRLFHNRLNFENSFFYGGKKFDSGELAYFTEERNYGLSVNLSFNYQLNQTFLIGSFVNYSKSLISQNGLYLEERKEFLFWDKSTLFDQSSLSSSHQSIIENSFHFGFNIMVAY